MNETKGSEGPRAKPAGASENSCKAETIADTSGGESQRGSEQGRKQSTDQTPPDPQETGGREGPDPTRYGDWEKAGRCIDF